MIEDRRAGSAQQLRRPLPIGLERDRLPDSVRDDLAERVQCGGGFQRNQAAGTEIGARGVGVAMPPFAHGPQLTPVAGSPCALR